MIFWFLVYYKINTVNPSTRKSSFLANINILKDQDDSIKKLTTHRGEGLTRETTTPPRARGFLS